VAKKTKKLRTYLLVVAFAVGTVWFLSQYLLKTEIKTFMGVIVSTTNDSVTIRWMPVGVGIDPDKFISDQIDTIFLDNTTEIIKYTGQYSLRGDVNSDGVLSREDVTRERKKVAKEQFLGEATEQKIFVKILAENSFFNREIFKADTVYYNSDNIMFDPR